MIKISIALLCLFSASSYAIAPASLNATTKSHQVNRGTLNNVSVDGLLNKSSHSLLDELDMQAVTQGQNGVVRIKQLYRGVEVYGSEVVYKIENGKILSRDGRIAEISLDSVVPKVSATKAQQIASAKLSGARKFEQALKVYPLEGKTYLVWHVKENSFSSQWNYFVDASNGQIVDSFNAIQFGSGAGHDGETVEVDSVNQGGKYVLDTTGEFSRKTHDAKNGGMIFGPIIIGLPGDLASSSDDFWKDMATVDAHVFAGNYLKVLKEKFNRKSFDDKGAQIVSTVHFMKNFVNAFWNGKQMVYGDGDGKQASNLAGGYDVVAHEITHAVTTSTSNLTYRNESGALNEAFSDIMATYAEFVSQPKRFDWLIGEDIWTPGKDGDALRYMNDPKKDGRSFDFYPERYQGDQDAGGVHLNSGIANLAFYLMSEGGKHPRKGGMDVKGIGITSAIQIFYKAFSEKLVASSTFADARNATVKVAKEMGKSASFVQSVGDAWTAVGVK